MATRIVVGIAMIGSLTVLPALHSRLGDKVEKGRIPFLHRLRRESGENRFWKAILTHVLRRPVVSAITAGAVRGPMALAVPRLPTSESGPNSLPNRAPTVGTMHNIQRAFSTGEASPASSAT